MTSAVWALWPVNQTTSVAFAAPNHLTRESLQQSPPSVSDSVFLLGTLQRMPVEPPGIAGPDSPGGAHKIRALSLPCGYAKSKQVVPAPGVCAERDRARETGEKGGNGPPPSNSDLPCCWSSVSGPGAPRGSAIAFRATNLGVRLADDHLIPRRAGSAAIHRGQHSSSR